MSMSKRILVAVTGASGSIYAERLVEVLLNEVDRIYLVFSETAEKVARTELKISENRFSLIRYLNGDITEHEKRIIRHFSNSDLFSPVASGSSAPTHMVIVPCSMGCLARIATGTSSNLIERAADVVLKEKEQLIIVPRETPLSQIHLENMLTLSKLGVSIIPAMPGFYNRPDSIEDLVDFMVARILKSLHIEQNNLIKRWNSRLI